MATQETSAGEFLAFLQLLCGARSDSRILDIGCGYGLMALALERYLGDSGRYVGLDVDKGAVTWARRKIASRHPNFEFQHLDIRNEMYNPHGKPSAEAIELPIQNQRFDVVLLKSVFTHLRPAEVDGYLHQIRQCMVSDGYCLATFFLFNPDQASNSTQRLSSIEFKFGDDHWRYAIRDLPEAAIAHNERSVRRMAAKAGLKITKFFYGTWSGRSDGLSYQDILVLQPVVDSP